MCGIVGYCGKSMAVPYLLQGLEKLEYRGYDSAGIALSEKNSINITKTKGRVSALQNILNSKKASFSCAGIGHTRWATHGEPSDVNAHPHLSQSGLFAVVHNGIIENYHFLKQKLQSEGYSFASDTDTEVVSHLLERNYNGRLEETVRKTAGMLKGSFALAILCKDFPDTIICTRNGSPLVVGQNSEGSFVASDALALSQLGEEFRRPDDGEIVILKNDKVLFFSKDGLPIEKETEKISFSTDSADKNGYPHFMLKEIYEQPQAVERTIRSFVKNGEIRFPCFALSESEVKSITSIYIVACGSAFHVGLCGKYIIEELTGIPVHTDIASEFRYRSPALKKSDLCIIISQSGETADSIAALKKAKEKGVKVLSIVNVKNSTIPTLSDYVIYTEAGPEIAVATTKAYSAQLAVIYSIAIYLSEILKHKDGSFLSEALKAVEALPQKISLTIEHTQKKSRELAHSLYQKEHIYFIGRDTDYATAMEGSLKLKEISYIHCEAYGAGELKHGTISLVEKGTPVIALMAKKKIFTKTFSNVKEVKARSATVIAITTEQLSESTEGLDEKLIIPDCHSLVVPSIEVIPLQLLSYYTALIKGCDIDKPRNLAKSVTVE